MLFKTLLPRIILHLISSVSTA